MFDNGPSDIIGDSSLAIGVQEVEAAKMSAADLAQACKIRKNYKVVRDMTKEAFAAYYGRDALFPYIMPFSSKEDRLKIRMRCEKTVQHYENYPHEISQTYVEG